ncbi:LOW QUALITY PROTEIN: serine/threonine-protein kinase pim-1-like [Agelaius phoeniceus]|uniref:LOW QUALITY PROTEIN: serine/threonine-protein kinase pim-1-like n=1 Tax=Agelaius phoeniceus TaxID=39638 RepID=UPI004054C641
MCGNPALLVLAHTTGKPLKSQRCPVAHILLPRCILREFQRLLLAFGRFSSTEEACEVLASIPVCALDPLCVESKHQTAVGTLVPRCAVPEVVCTVLWLRLVRALARPRPRTKPLPRLRSQPPRGRPAPAPSPGAPSGAFPVRAPPLASSVAGPEPPVPGAFVCPGQNGESAVPPARAQKPPLEQLYREGLLLGSGGCGIVCSGTRLADGAPVAIKRVSRDRIPEWGALVPLELALLWMESCPGFRGVVRLLDWFELPDGFALVTERPERCQELWYFLDELGFLTEPVARGLFGQVLEAVRTHCSSCGVLHRHIKAENVLADLATGEAKLIGFGCGTILQDSFYTRMSGTLEYSPPEWILFGCYHGQPATIWPLGILLYELVCGHLPFHTREGIIRGQLFFPSWVSEECQHLIRWCLYMDPTERPSLEDLFEHSWLLDPHVAQETAEIHPSAQ